MITVKDLIRQLQKMPPNASVWIKTDSECCPAHQTYVSNGNNVAYVNKGEVIINGKIKD